jgi:hypothetical protein
MPRLCVGFRSDNSNFTLHGRRTGVPPVHVCPERNAQIYKGAIQLGGRKETVASPDWVVGRAGFRKHDRDFRQMLVALRDPFLTQEVEAARLKLFPYDETSGKSSLFT